MRKAIYSSLFMMLSYLPTMAQNAIDVHSHIIPQNYLEYLDANNALMEEGFPLPKWDIDSQIRWMDEAGIKTSVLTLAAPQPYFGNIKTSKQLIRKINEQAASIKNNTLTGFYGVPLFPYQTLMLL